jgi:hypothetical protein
MQGHEILNVTPQGPIPEKVMSRPSITKRKTDPTDIEQNTTKTLIYY